MGISKAHTSDELPAAIAEAFRHDEKILVEPFVDGREIEVAVLGNHHPRASVPGEIVPCNEFYDYRAKYLDGRSELHIPAPISAGAGSTLRDLAVAPSWPWSAPDWPAWTSSSTATAGRCW